MLDRISWWFWWALGVDLALVAAYLAGIVWSQRGSTGTARKVRVEYLREPMTALLTALGIAVALVAAAGGYLANQRVESTSNLLVLALGCFILAAIVALRFLLGLPNLAASCETVTFTFKNDWDVVVYPNLAAALVIIGLIQLSGYFLFELRFPPPAPERAARAGMVTVWSADRPCTVETDLRDGKVRIAVDNRRPAGASPSGVTCTARVSLPEGDRP
jgi:hypothetical protein